MGPQTRRKSHLLYFLLLAQLVFVAVSHCDNTQDDNPIFRTEDGEEFPSITYEGPLEYEGFRMNPNLIEETISDALRSKEEQKLETSTSTQHPFEHSCPNGYFVCTNGECIAKKWRCDGHYDCDDFSDELNCTTLDLPQHGSIAPLSSTVYTAPTRPNLTQIQALSTQVYGLDFNSSVEPLMIFSTGGSIRGYWMKARVYFDIVLRQKPRTPAPTQPSISEAFSLFFGLFGADAPGGKSQGSSSSPSSSSSSDDSSTGGGKSESTIVGLDMDPNNKEVFWVELGKEPGVFSAIIEDEQFQARHRRQFHGHRKVVEFGLLSPEDIALDTVARNAYITDAGLPAIVVCSYTHVSCKILLQDHTRLHKPRAIIADSSTGWVTFTDWGDRPGIYLLSMDGRRFETLIDTDVVWPNGLAADHSTNRLYWADARLNKIERVDLVTRQRTILIKEKTTNPFSVSMFENRIYWSDWSKNEIKTCNKDTGNSSQVVMHADDIYGIHIYHPDLYQDQQANPCWSKHCTHLCLLTPSSPTYSPLVGRQRNTLSATCACPDSMILSGHDKATCIETDSSFVLINVHNYVAQLFPERIGQRVLDDLIYSKTHEIQDIAGDWQNLRIFFFDASRQEIFTADFMNHLEVSNFTRTPSKSIRGLTYDMHSDNLYWLDPDSGALIMCAVSANFQKVLKTNLGKAVSLALDSKNRVLYIASIGGDNARIIRTDMTGSEKSDVVLVDRSSHEGGIGQPVALHLDEQLQRLYWADAAFETIESIDLDIKSRSTGVRMNSRHIHRRRLGPILSMTIYQDSFLWLVQNDHSLYKGKISPPKGSRPTLFKLPPKPAREHLTSDCMRLITVLAPTETSFTPSACHLAGCSHGCILDSSHSAKCVCPDKFKLSIVNRTNCIEASRMETTPAPPTSTTTLSAIPLNKAPVVIPAAAVAAAGSGAGIALNNIIAHLDGAKPAETKQNKATVAAAAAAAAATAKIEVEHSQLSMNTAHATHTHENEGAAAVTVAPMDSTAHYGHLNHRELPAAQSMGHVDVTAEELAEHPHQENNRMVWLIVFLLILSAGGLVTVLSLLMLHKQGRLPRQVSVSFISPGGVGSGIGLGGGASSLSRSQDKDRAMLLLDTDDGVLGGRD